MKNLILIILSCCIISAVSCKKLTIYDPYAEPILPPITSEGRDTFGLLFGTEVWVPNTIISQLTACYPCVSSNPKLDIAIRRLNAGPTRVGGTFNIQYFNPSISVGTYPLNSTTCEIDMRVMNPNNVERKYQLEDTGTITFTRFDLISKIASGTFSMTVKDAVSGEKVSISQGRFDVKFVE